MSKQTLVFLLGILLTILPFLGIPEEWRQYFIAGVGALLILVGYALRRERFFARLERGDGERGTDSFIETTERLFE